jgi:GT2 family glycosyltransferase
MMETSFSIDDKPLLSIIIASYHSGNQIGHCLESLKNQKTSKPYEIIVVNSSSDGVGTWIEKRFPGVKLYQFSERKFCGDARNFGLSVARGQIIAFMDADCRAEPDWVDNILKAHQSPHLAIGGAIANGNPESLVGWAAYFCEFSQWMPGFPPRRMADIAGASMSYKRRVFEEHGLFIEGTYSSDTEFHWRLREKGQDLVFVPSILTFHHNLDRFSKFLKHEFEHGRSFARVRMKTQKFTKWRRGVYATFCFLIPGWLFLQIAIRNFRNRIYLLHFFMASPLLILGLISWSLGEYIDYVKGGFHGNPK